MSVQLATVPYRGLRCREETCKCEIILVDTTRGRKMPLERELVRRGDDDRGLYVTISDGVHAQPVAYTIRAALELGLAVPPRANVYRAHWAGCPTAASFRRR